ncbi:CBS domain-containing protein [Halogranum gelatinilyticum]|uniref:CBS domain-containing protein n=1 Tax=Halogranum gelatinilyticum TaxID=660521 RepID=A0A1G9SVW1_9EURY|nr:CBS domain-containing protein [Halogranum gelatinilyticum]SDM39514.1 CBS domain-containing protein [Halogranum gelatinilyticum]
MRENVTVHDITGQEYVGVSEGDTVEAAAELMLTEGVDSIVVLRGRDPVGMLTSRDALGALLAGTDTAERTVDTVMSELVPRVDAADDIDVAADIMFSEAVDRLLVFDDGEFVGLLTQREVMAATASRTPDNGPTADVDGGQLLTDGSDFETETDEFSTQSICEVCGALVHDLGNVNGQLVCVDCREV